VVLDLLPIRLTHSRSRSRHYISPYESVRKYIPGNISVVPTRIVDATGVGESGRRMACRLQASIVDTRRYNRLLPITSNMSSRVDDEESSIILQNKMARACGVPVHTHRIAALLSPIFSLYPNPFRCEISSWSNQKHDVHIIGIFVEELDNFSHWVHELKVKQDVVQIVLLLLD